MCEAVDVSDGDLCSGARFYVPRQNKERTTVYVQTQAICEFAVAIYILS